MFTIVMPLNNLQERKYILDVVFNQFFKISYKCIVSSENIDEYQIYKENKKIVIKDAFFSFFSNDLEYLKLDAVPNNVKYFSHFLLAEDNLPVLFGSEKIEVEENKIVSHIDIFATMFFMLTRWEEYVNLSRDEHKRFKAKDSVAYKYGFLERPIVNEYLELLWNMFEFLKFDEKRYSHKFSMILTHDVDEILAYPTIKKFLRRTIGDIVIRKSLPLAVEKVCAYSAMVFQNRKDPYDTFDEIMDISEKFNLKSHFFFMSGGNSRYDNYYSIDSSMAKHLIHKIKERGHFIGVHPSYNAYNDNKQFEMEKRLLESSSEVDITFGREHYLRFEVPTTWQIWEDNKMQWCSNMTYADCSGFRAGTCYSYTPFNILTRKQLSLRERPLTIMEVTLMCETSDEFEFENKLDRYLTIVKKYEGEFVFLWHNSNFKIYEDFSNKKIKKYISIYKKILQKSIGVEY